VWGGCPPQSEIFQFLTPPHPPPGRGGVLFFFLGINWKIWIVLRARGAGATLMRLCAMLISATQAVHNCVLTAWRTSATVGWKIFWDAGMVESRTKRGLRPSPPRLLLLLLFFIWDVFWSPPLRGRGVGGLKTEIFHFGGVTPPTPRNISAKNFWFIMVSPGPSWIQGWTSSSEGCLTSSLSYLFSWKLAVAIYIHLPSCVVCAWALPA
jgi:hypothetical protein